MHGIHFSDKDTIVNIAFYFSHLKEYMLGWPLIFYVIGISLLCTVLFGFVQFRYFFAACKKLLIPEKTTSGDMSPFQAFINTLSANLGNGGVAGMATAIFMGGPGAAFWVVEGTYGQYRCFYGRSCPVQRHRAAIRVGPAPSRMPSHFKRTAFGAAERLRVGRIGFHCFPAHYE